ncbi:MAG: fibronectin type III-like domain-contianing protein, partial [Lentisphaeria bacterium]
PLYPFGFGLSYTTFEYSGLHADARISWRDLEQGRKIPVEVTIKNTGHTAAQEVVQCYVRDVVASMTRPLRELKGFQKIELQPEETKRVIFDLGKDELGFYNGDGQYVVEPGTFEIYVGGDCLTRNVVSVEVIG